MHHSIPTFCGSLEGCVCIATHPRENASTTCGSGTKATQLLLGFAGLCVHCNAPAPKRDRSLWQRNISVVCYVALCGAVRAFASKFSKFAASVQKARRCVVLCPDMFQCLLALCDAYSRFSLDGDGHCERAARAQLRGNQTQPLAQWRLAAPTRPQNCRCPRLFGPLEG